MPRPYGRVCSHLQCDRLSLGLTLKNRRVNCTFTGKPIIRPTANCSAFDVSTLTRHFVFTLYCSHQTVPCSVLRRVDPKSPLHIHSTLFTPVVRPTVPCSELRRSEDWPSQHIRVVVGRCIRTNTIICKQPPCPPPPPSSLTILRNTVFPPDNPLFKYTPYTLLATAPLFYPMVEAI